jgi:hypothetical protein
MNKISAKMRTFHILAEISIDFERIIIYNVIEKLYSDEVYYELY